MHAETAGGEEGGPGGEEGFGGGAEPDEFVEGEWGGGKDGEDRGGEEGGCGGVWVVGEGMSVGVEAEERQPTHL